jgi:HNH endonuclease
MHPQSTVERFWSKVEFTDDCWHWMGLRNGDGYGRFWIGKCSIAAHRAAYELLVGPIPPGFTIDHLCRNPPCVRFDHLEPVTPGENTLRGRSPSAINARKTHCSNGHEFTLANTYCYPSGRRRRCRICKRIHLRQWRREKKLAAETSKIPSPRLERLH